MVGHANADPGRVFASGQGLYQGETGKFQWEDLISSIAFNYLGIPCEFLIDTMNAGAGALAVTVDGPSKVQLDCREVAEGKKSIVFFSVHNKNKTIVRFFSIGYRVSFTPTAPGDYLITIKFAGVNIAGSPFKCLVGGVALNSGRSKLISLTICNRFHWWHYYLDTQTRYNTIEQTSSYVSTSRNNYATVDASRVRAHGEGLTRAYRNEKATFTVDTRDGGQWRGEMLVLSSNSLFVIQEMPC